MVRLCRESSRSYSGRPAVRPHRQRWERRPAMAVGGMQESAEAVVPRVTSRETNRTDSQLGKGRTWQAEHDHRWSGSRGDEADWPSPGPRSPWQRQSGCFIRQDCQEPPDADPHVRWCGRRGEQSPRRPDWASRLLISSAICPVRPAQTLARHHRAIVARVHYREGTRPRKRY
jgi:hypothetical protein